MKIRTNLLVCGFASQWVNVPASPAHPEWGCGRVKIKELPKDKFDALWSALSIAEKEASEKVDELGVSHPDAVKARQAEQEAGYAVIEACIVDHDPKTFEASVETPEDEQSLREIGYSYEEIEQAKKEGVARRAFSKEGMARFYERCAPWRSFFAQLLQAIHRYVALSEILVPAQIWHNAGIERERILASPFAPTETQLALWDKEQNRRREIIQKLRSSRLATDSETQSNSGQESGRKIGPLVQ